MHREIGRIREKLLNEPWPQYLRSVTIAGLRGWNGQEIRFDFPVTVVAGENGSGKSTVLKVAATAYSHPSDRNLSFYPDVFFPDTPWEDVSNVSLTYRVEQGQSQRAYIISKKTRRWRGFENRPKRNVIVQDISRTLPLDATVGYARIAKRGTESATSTTLGEDWTSFYNAIMGRTYDSVRIASNSLDARKLVGVVEWGGKQFSQFHQGAGEDATLDLLRILKDVPDYSLIIIDEVEASLHPRSQRRLIHFLLWLSRMKKIQVILSTHSGYILDELPLEARVFLSRIRDDVKVLYGVSKNYAMSRMDDYDQPDLYIFTEDEESTVLVDELLRFASVELSRYRCMEVGPSNVVQVLGALASKSRLPVPAIGVLDADQQPEQGCICLPGSLAPERQVFSDIRDGFAGTLAQRLGISEGSVIAAFDRAMSLGDHHDWIEHAARELSQSNRYLWETMCQLWVRTCISNSDANAFVQEIVGVR